MIDSTIRSEIVQRLLSVADMEIAVTEATSLREDLSISSMDLITLAADLEQELGIIIDDDMLFDIRTVGDLFKAVDKAKGEGRI
jgi:acyl carrier protein